MWISRLTDLLIKTTFRVLEEFMHIIQCSNEAKEVMALSSSCNLYAIYIIQQLHQCKLNFDTLHESEIDLNFYEDIVS